MKTLLFVAWVTGHSLDAASSHLALNQPNTRELHPFLQQTVWVNVGAGVGGGLAVRAFYRQHPKIAIALTIADATLHTYATVHNVRVARGARR